MINICQYKRNCPDCNKEIIYSSKKSLSVGTKNNGVCPSCRIKGDKNPLFGKRRWNKGLHWSDEIKKKISDGNKGKIVLNETKLKISSANRGRKLSDDHKRKIIRTGKVSGMKGKHHTEATKIIIGNHSKGNNYHFKNHHSDITKRKMRESHIKRLKLLGICPRYNLNGCNFIDKLNEQLGIELQHAKNGGEKVICGYFVDGYDEKRNVVIEYDEQVHYDITNNLRNKDIVRQKHIIDEINPIIFFRYNEKIKELRDIKTNIIISTERNLKFNELQQMLKEKSVKINDENQTFGNQRS